MTEPKKWELSNELNVLGMISMSLLNLFTDSDSGDIGDWQTNPRIRRSGIYAINNIFVIQILEGLGCSLSESSIFSTLITLLLKIIIVLLASQSIISQGWGLILGERFGLNCLDSKATARRYSAMNGY